MLSNNAVCENSHWRSPLRYQKSNLAKLLDKYDKKDKLMNEMIKYNVLCVDPMDLHNDLCLRNVVQSCLDFDNPKAMYEKANYFLDVIFRQPYSYGHNFMLMGLWN